MSATIVESQDISPESARNPKKRGRDSPEVRGEKATDSPDNSGMKEVMDLNAIIAKKQDTSPETAKLVILI